MPRLHYHALRAKDEDFTPIIRSLGFVGLRDFELSMQIFKTQKSGTTKYTYNNTEHLYYYNSDVQVEFNISVTNISFPYMLYEGYSCMYGGIYILKTSSLDESEILSHCVPSATRNKIIIPRGDFAIVIIHYSEYSSPMIILSATIAKIFDSTFPVNLTVSGNKSAETKILSLQGADKVLYLQSILLKLRKLQHIYINIQSNEVTKIRFATERSGDCIYCTVIYAPHLSNVWGRQYDMEVSNKAFRRRDFIRAIYINMSLCSTFIIPIWSVSIETDNTYPLRVNFTHYLYLSDFLLRKYQTFHEMYMFPVWYMVHMINLKPNVIWRVWIEACHTVSHVSIEVPTDAYLSTSVYKWNHYNNIDNVYMTIDKTANILFMLDNGITNITCRDVFYILFLRYFIYDEGVGNDIALQTLEPRYFILHNLR